MSAYPDEEMKAMEEDYRCLRNKADDLEQECEAKSVHLLDLSIDWVAAIDLLNRTRKYLTHFPISEFDRKLQSDIVGYLERMELKLSQPQGKGGP